MYKLRLAHPSELVGKLGVVFLMLSFYTQFWVESLFSFTQYRNLLFGIALVFFVLRFFLRPLKKVQPTFFLYAFLGLILLVISSFFWYSLSGMNVYLSLITALFLVSLELQFFLKTLKFLVFVMLVLAIYEAISKTYLFVVYRQTEWGLKPLDPTFFGGYAKIFRAKALFEGPLALAQFAIGTSLVFRRNILIVVIGIILSFLANGRLGIIICSLILVIYFFEKFNLRRFLRGNKLFFTLVFVILGSIAAFKFLISEKTISRLENALNATDTGNTGRFYYWQKATEIFGDYDFWHMLFGNSGLYRSTIGNSAENGWLMLLVDNGYLGFLYYIFPLILIAILSLVKNSLLWLFVCLITICMVVQTFHLGVSANLLYWIIAYLFAAELLKKRDKNYA